MNELELIAWCQIVADYWNMTGSDKYLDLEKFGSRDAALIHQAVSYLRLNTNDETQDVVDYIIQERKGIMEFVISRSTRND